MEDTSPCSWSKHWKYDCRLSLNCLLNNPNASERISNTQEIRTEIFFLKYSSFLYLYMYRIDVFVNCRLADRKDTVWMQIFVVVKSSHRTAMCVCVCLMFKRVEVWYHQNVQQSFKIVAYTAKLIVLNIALKIVIGLHFQVFNSARRTFIQCAISHAISVP